MKNRMRSLWSPIVNALGISTLLLISSSTSAQTIKWIRQFGVPSPQSAGHEIAADVDADGGNVYVSGYTNGTLPGQAAVTGMDAFVRKYDMNGNEVWTHQFGSSSYDAAYGLIADAAFVYVVGITGSALPGQMSAGDNDAFIRKYDVNGNEVWTRQFGTPAWDAGYNLVVDATGIYMTGETRGALPGQISAGDCDIFVRKYDFNGDELWTRQFGSSSCESGYGLASDATGVYVASMFGGTLPGQTNAGGYDAFVRKYDVNGNELWTRQFGTSANDEAYSVWVYAGGIYVTGSVRGALPGQFHGGGRDAFVRKYDVNGNELWTRQFGTSSDDYINTISVDATAVSVSGETDGVLPGQTSVGGRDAFVRRYDMDGNELWTYQFGTSGYDAAYSVSSEISSFYVVGEMDGDAFIAKFGSPNQPPVLSSDQLIIITNEGQTATNIGTVTDPDADAVTLSASVGTVTKNGNGTWSWSFTTSDGPAQNQAVTISADDGNGGAAQTSFALTVNNVAPSVNAVTVPVNPISISSQPVSVSASFSDPAGTNDNPFTCAIDFGDGSGPQAGTISGMTCSGSHTYASAGVYVVTVTVTDKDNGSGSVSASNFIVVYDPSAGYVTGSGWIDSPLGAYVPNPTLIGRANFGFVSKYQKGKSTPDGNTIFHFNTASFKFKSTGYEWLVIAGPKAQYKGVGTVNNSGNYGFLLFARDGQVNGGGGVDKFRIKIWDKNNGDVIVYDNQMGDPDNGDATDAIEGGSIEIHGSSAKAVAGSSDEEIVSVPAEYALEQNYPNPFNPETEIRFQLPEATHVVLKVFNSVGEEVRIMVDSRYGVGHYSVRWDGKYKNGNPAPSGLYFCQILAGSFSDVKKMSLVR